MFRPGFCRPLIACSLALVASCAGAAASPSAQTFSDSPFAGFGSEPQREPIQISRPTGAESLQDKDQKAVLSGNVRISQGDVVASHRRACVICYEDGSDSSGALPPRLRPPRGPSTTTARHLAPAGAAGGQQNVRRFEMEGGVIVRSKNQTATAERGVFDARRNEAIMEGNVVLTQCENVLRGSRLQADLTANRVRLDGGASTGGRVSGVLSGGPQAAGGAGTSNPDCAGPARPAARPRG